MSESELIVSRYLHPERRIFVTGVYGSGKTTYAKQYAELVGFKYIDFDMYFNYSKTLSVLSAASDVHFINILSTEFITDAIPWNPKTESTEFFCGYARTNEVRIVCCVCPDMEVWKQRLLNSKRHVIENVTNENFKHYATFYYKILTRYYELSISYYDTIENEFISKEELYRRIEWTKKYLSNT